MKRVIFIASIVISFSSCVSLYDIYISPNSATVKAAKPIDDEELHRYFNSNVITKIDTTQSQIIFDISSLDSLGNYLPFLNSGFVQFRKKGSMLTIRDGQTEQVFCCSGASFVRVNLNLHFSSNIQLDSFKGSPKLNESTNSIYISKSRNKLQSNQHNTEVIVIMDSD